MVAQRDDANDGYRWLVHYYAKLTFRYYGAQYFLGQVWMSQSRQALQHPGARKLATSAGEGANKLRCGCCERC
jgi:hypothetical protein